MHVLIDRDGIIYPAYGAALDLVTRGFIRLQSDRNRCHVYSTPARSSIAMMASLERLLEQRRSDRTHLTWYDGAWHDEIFGNHAQLVARISDVMDCKPDDRYLVRNAKPSEFSSDNPLSAVLDLWRATGGSVCMAEHGDHIGRHINTYLTAFADDGAVRFGSFGDGWKIYQSDNWLTKCVGQRVEYQPDVNYGTWVACNYSSMLQAMAEPIATVCDVLVSDPTGDGDKRIQYTRLNLPVTGLDGRRHLLNVAYKHDHANLRRSLPLSASPTENGTHRQ